MNQLQIIGVVPSPLVRIGEVTIHSGSVGLERNPGFRGIVRPTDLEDWAFFVPDSEPYAAADGPASLGLETSLRSIVTMGNPNVVAFGAHDAQVALAPDPRGTDQRWLQVSFRTAAASVQRVEINYRVTVQR